MSSYDLEVGDKVYFKTEKRPYAVKANNESFTICTKPFNLQHTCLYTIIDWQKMRRNRNNMVFNPYDYMLQDDIDQCLKDLSDPNHGNSSRQFWSWRSFKGHDESYFFLALACAITDPAKDFAALLVRPSLSTPDALLDKGLLEILRELLFLAITTTSFQGKYIIF